MIIELRAKIRGLVEDLIKSDEEPFTYETGDKIFTLQESNVTNVLSVSKNGVALGSGSWSFDSDTSEITVSADLVANDIITAKYTFYKYTDSELKEYVRAALVWISVFAYCEDDMEIEDDEVFPTPDNKTEDLIALVASILIKPDYSEYRLPTVTVKYPRNMCKEEKIENIIQKFKIGLGVNDVLKFD